MGFRRVQLGLISVFLAMCSGGAAHAQSEVGTGAVNPANNVRYHLLTPSTWTDARNFAAARGWHIVTINDAAENLWVRQTFANFNAVVHPEIWIGINDVSVEGQFVWHSGQPVTFTNWNSTEPNDSGGIEEFGVMATASGGWNDARNDNNSHFGTSIAAVLEEPNPIVLAVCCSTVTGACVIAQPGVCSSLGFVAVLTESTCRITSCTTPSTGACCTATSCVLSVAATCQQRFLGVGSVCNPLACCSANFDSNLALDIQDIFAFISAWFAGCP